MAEFFRCGNNYVLWIKCEDLTQIIVYTYVTNRGVCAEERDTESIWVEVLRQCKPCDFLHENFVLSTFGYDLLCAKPTYKWDRFTCPPIFRKKVDSSTFFFFLICGNCASWIILTGYTALSITGLRLPVLRELPELHRCFPSPSARARRRIPLYTGWFRRKGQCFGGGVTVSVIVIKVICMIICVILNIYRGRDVWIHKHKTTVNGNNNNNGYSALGPVWQEPEPSPATSMAPICCILGKFLGVVCHCFPPYRVYIIKIKIGSKLRQIKYHKNKHV